MDRVNMKLNPKSLTYSPANNTLIIAVSFIKKNYKNLKNLIFKKQNSMKNQMK